VEHPWARAFFAERSYPAYAVIGEITGDVVTDCPSGSGYAFETDDRTQLEPQSLPFPAIVPRRRVAAGLSVSTSWIRSIGRAKTIDQMTDENGSHLTLDEDICRIT